MYCDQNLHLIQLQMIKYTVFSLYLKGLFIQNDDVRLGISVKLQKVMEIAISVLDDVFLEEKKSFSSCFCKITSLYHYYF